MQLFEDVRRQGVKLGIFTYSSLTITCEKGKDLTQAMRLFEDVRRQGVKLGIFTYSSLTSARGKGQDLW